MIRPGWISIMRPFPKVSFRLPANPSGSSLLLELG
jgi:hypothetical protein